MLGQLVSLFDELLTCEDANAKQAEKMMWVVPRHIQDEAISHRQWELHACVALVRGFPYPPIASFLSLHSCPKRLEQIIKWSLLMTQHESINNLLSSTQRKSLGYTLYPWISPPRNAYPPWEKEKLRQITPTYRWWSPSHS